MKLTLKELIHNENIFSASTENGPVTPRIVRGWIDNLYSFSMSSFPIPVVFNSG